MYSLTTFCVLLCAVASAQADIGYAKQLIARGEYALATVTLNKQLADLPVEARALLARVYMLEGAFGEATRYLEAAREKGLAEARYYALKGRIAVMQGRWNTAWAALRSAVALSGRTDDALYWGTVGLAQGNLDRALLGFGKAERAGAPARAAFLRGLALLPAEPDRALQELRAAQVQLDSEDPLKPQAIYWQARALERLGRAGEARSTLRFLLRSYPGYGAAQDALNRLGP